MSDPGVPRTRVLDPDDREKVRAGRPLLAWTLAGWAVLAGLIWLVGRREQWPLQHAVPIGASALVAWFVTVLFGYSLRDLLLVWRDDPQLVFAAPERRAWRQPWLPVAAVLAGIALGYFGWK